MNESMRKYMRVSVVHFAYPTSIKREGPVTETIKKIAIGSYFSAIEINPIKVRTESGCRMNAH